MDEQSCARGRARRGGVTGGLSAAARGRRRATRPGRQYDGKMRRRVRIEAVYANGAWLTNLVVRYVYEPAGNVTALASASGSLIGRHLYDPFGNTLGVAGAAAEANLYRFSSKEWHEASGLVYYLYRYYEPSLQRWVNRDPIGDEAFEIAVSRRWLVVMQLAEGADIVGRYDFTAACEAHDKCYDTCGESKKECDEEFFRNMVAECMNWSGHDWPFSDCRIHATIHHGLRIAGGRAYRDAPKCCMK